MTKTNKTRSALFTSIISLLLCVSMLVGTTFAWFTDTAASGLNEIIAGNLDVALLDNAGNSVEGDTELFTMPELWEPGAVAYTQLQVVNKGTLDLKASLSINFEDVNNIEGHVLSEVLQYAIIDSNVDLSSREAVLAAAKESDNKGSLDIYDFTFELQAGEASDLQTLVIFWWPNANDVDNLYNVNNGKTTSDGQPLQINLGVKVFATQLGGNENNEHDSFGPDYDENAPALIRFNNVNYDTFAEALAAARAANGGTIEISGNVEFQPVAQHEGFNHGDENLTGITVKGIDSSAVLTIVGGGVPDIVGGTFEDLILADEGTYLTTANEFMYQNFANATFTNVTFVDGVRIGKSHAGTANNLTTFTECKFYASTHNEYALWIDTGTVKIAGCEFVATSEAYGVIKVETADANVAITGTSIENNTAKQDINSDFGATITIDGVPYYNVETAEQMAEVLDNSDAKKIINLDSSMKMVSSGTSSEVTITAAPGAVLDLTWGAYLENAKLTFDGVTIKGSTGYVTSNGTNYGSDYAALYSHNVTYKDCTFDGPFRIGRDGAAFNKCTFTNLGNDYVWTYGNNASFTGCTFNTDGKSLLIYSDGGNEVSQVSVTGCTFNATKEAFAGAVPGMPCAAIEIDNYGCGVNLTTSDNTIGENFSAEWRIKSYDANKAEVTVNGVTYTGQTVGGNAFVVVGTTDELAAALTAGKTNIYLKDGTYSVPAAAKGKTLTLTGSRNAIIQVNDAGSYEHTDGGFDGSTVTFNGITIKTREVTHYAGFVRMSGTYNNCAIVGNYGLFGDSTFTGCEFNANVGEHCVWTYGANNVTFTGCSFTYGDRGINCYRESGDKQTVKFTNCTFTTTNTASKGAVEINSCYFTTGIEVNMEGCTAPAHGTMVGISGWDTTNGAKTTVTVDGAAFSAPQWAK